MKKVKYIAICIILLFILLLIFEKPILYSYYTYNAVEIEIEYCDDLLSYPADFETSGKSKYVQCEEISDEIHIKLPQKTNIVTIKSESDKSCVYNLQTCFERKDKYCFIFRMLYAYFPLNSKTHKWDKLVILDEDGNESGSFKSSAEEWILDYADGAVLIYNSKVNSFYYKDITSSIPQKVIMNDCDNYNKITLSCKDCVWQVYFYYNNKLVYQTAPTFN